MAIRYKRSTDFTADIQCLLGILHSFTCKLAGGKSTIEEVKVQEKEVKVDKRRQTK